MSIRSDGGAGNWADREASGAPDYNANYTISLWFKTEQLAAFKYFFGMFNSGAANNQDSIAIVGDGSHDEIETELAGVYGSNGTGTVALSTNTWYFIALRRTSVTAINSRLNTSADGASTSASVAGRAASDRLTLFGGPSESGQFAGTIAQVRFWSTDLTDGELNTEKASSTPVKLTSLWGAWELATAVADNGQYPDSSGNSRPLRCHGTFTNGSDNPPNGGAGTPGVMWLH